MSSTTAGVLLGIHALAAGDWTEAGRRLGQIRRLVGFNLILGLFTVAWSIQSENPSMRPMKLSKSARVAGRAGRAATSTAS